MRTLACAVLVAATACGTVREGPVTGAWSWVAEREDNGYLDRREGGVYATRAEAQVAVDRFLRSSPEFMGRGWVVPAQPEDARSGGTTERSPRGPPAVGRSTGTFASAITRVARSSFLCGDTTSNAAASG